MKRLLLPAIFASTSILGFADPLPELPPSITPLTSTSFHLDWDGTLGNTYFVQYSADLISWDYMPVIKSGVGGPLGYGFDAVGGKLFLRLHYTGAATSNPLNDDFDGDGISNWDEIRLGGSGTNPFLWDTDGDGKSDYLSDRDGNGMNDGWELKHYATIGILDPLGDPDGDGWDNTLESELDTSPNAHANTNDEDQDGLVDALDAVPDDSLINWPLTQETSYAYIELDDISGLENVIPIAISESGHVLVNAWTTGNIQNTQNYIWSPSTGAWEGPLSKTYNGVEGAYLEATDVGSDGKIVGKARVVNIDDDEFVHRAYEVKCVWANSSASPQLSGGSRLAVAGESWDVTADAQILAPQISSDGHELSMDYGRTSHASDGSGDPAEVKYGGAILDKWWDPFEILPDPSTQNHFGHPGANKTVTMYEEELTFNFETYEYEWDLTGLLLYQNGIKEQVASGGVASVVAQMPDSEGVLNGGRLAVTGYYYTWIKKDGQWKTTKRPLTGKRITPTGIILTVDDQIWQNGKKRTLEDVCPPLAAQGYTSSSAVDMTDGGAILIRAKTPDEQKKTGILLPVELEDDVFSTGVDDISRLANKDDPGFLPDCWIMAPVLDVDDDGGNLTEILIGGDVNSTTTLTADNATATPDTMNLGKPAKVIKWKGTGAGVDSEESLTMTLGQSQAPITLPIKVKAMKYRKLKVAVWRVLSDQNPEGVSPDDLGYIAPIAPDFNPTEEELEGYLDGIYAPQINVDIDCEFHDITVRFDTATGVSFGAPAEKLEVNNEFLDITGDLDLEFEAIKLAGYDNTAGINVYIVGGVNFIAANFWAPTVDRLLSTLASGLTDPDPNERICVVAGGFLNPRARDLDTTSHEIGHIFVGAGHPDSGTGPAPLEGTIHNKRLMCSGANRKWDGSSRLLTKVEWDVAESWLVAEEERLNN